jgi:DNA polymerase III subunit delta
MIVFLYGKDNFRSNNKLQEIREKYEEKFPSSLSYKKIDGKKLNLEELKSLVQGAALFQEKKLIVVRNVFDLKAEKQKELVEFLKDKKLDKEEDNIIIFWNEGDPDKRTSLFKYLNTNARSQGFSRLNKALTEKWIHRTLSEQFPDLKLSLPTVRLLAQNLESDLWRIYNELVKINAYSKNIDEALTEEDIKDLVVFPYEADIFETINALAEKNKRKALKSLSHHFKNLEPELKLLAMFEYQFRGLARTRSLIDEGENYQSAQRKTKIHPFAFRKMHQLAQNFSMNEIGMVYDELFGLDVGFKTGRIQDKQMALEMFVAKVCS